MFRHVQRMTWLIAVAAVLLAQMLLQSPVRAAQTQIQAATANRSAVLGGAYQSEKESFVGQQCLTGEIDELGSPRATFSFDQALSQSQASSLLGLEAGGKARFGVYEGSASARFMENATSTDQSVSAVWISEYVLPNKKLINPALNNIGEDVRSDDERWAKTCGDEYVDEMLYGARLFFSIRIDFSTAEQKQKFEAEFSVSGPLASAEASMEEATEQFSRDIKVKVSALQLGGDVSKLTEVIPQTQAGNAGFVDCTLGDFEKCADVISNALQYASNTTTGFPSQIAPGAEPGAAIMTYRTAEYSAVGIFPNNYPHLDEVIVQARQRLHELFEQQFKWSVLADRLLEIGLSTDQEGRIGEQRSKVDSNINQILDTSRVCYENPSRCPEAVNSLPLALEEIDEAAFLLPPPATASFRIWTSDKGVWDRRESVKVMNPAGPFSPADVLGNAVTNFHIPCPVYSAQLLEDLNDIAGAGSASVVLLLEGTALREATLYFENVLILADEGEEGHNLSFEPNSPKHGPGWAMLVLKSTRENPGWIDIDLNSIRQNLREENMPSADGVFNVIVEDGLGRESRFDIEYQQWASGVGGWGAINRWWDPKSDGISVLGIDNWTCAGEQMRLEQPAIR